MSLELFAVEAEIPSIKAQVVSACLGGQLTSRIVSRKDPELATILQKNQATDLPFLLTCRGTVMSTDSIIRLLARVNRKMYGGNSWEKAKVDEWLEYVSVQLSPLVKQIFGQLSQRKKTDSRRFDYARQALAQKLISANKHLQTRTFLVGDRLTIADISLAVQLLALGPALDGTATLVHLRRWLNHISCLPPLKSSNVKCKFEQLELAVNTRNAPSPLKETQHKNGVSEPKEPTKVPTSLQIEAITNQPGNIFDLGMFKTGFKSNKEEAIKYFFERYNSDGWSVWRLSYPCNLGVDSEKPVSEGVAAEEIVAQLKFKLNEAWKERSFGAIGVEAQTKGFCIIGTWLWKCPTDPGWQMALSGLSIATSRLDPSLTEHRDAIQNFWLARATKNVEYWL